MFGEADIAQATFQNNQTRPPLASSTSVGHTVGGSAFLKAE